MKYNIITYLMKIWGTSVLCSPFLLNCLGAWLFNWAAGNIGIFIVMIILGGLLSLPSLALLYMICYLLVQRLNSVCTLKLLLSFISLVLTFLPFLLLNASMEMDSSTLAICLTYLILIIAGIWLYELKPVSEEVTDVNL